MDSLERVEKWRSELKLFRRIYDDRVTSLKKIILDIFTQNDILKQLNETRETSDYVKDFLKESIQDVFNREEELHKSNLFLKTFPKKIQTIIRENSELKIDLKSFSLHSQKQIEQHEKMQRKLKKVKGIEKYSLKEKKKDQERIHHLTRTIQRMKENHEKVKLENEEIQNRSIQERTDIAQMIQKMKQRISKLKNEKENHRKLRKHYEEMKMEVVTLKSKVGRYKERESVEKKRKKKSTKRRRRYKKSRRKGMDSSDTSESESESSSEETEEEEKQPKRQRTREEKNLEKLIKAITSKGIEPKKKKKKKVKEVEDEEPTTTTKLHIALKDTLSKLTTDFISRDDHDEILESHFVPKEKHLDALREQQGKHLNDKKSMLERIAEDNKKEIREFERRKNEEFQATLDILKSEVSKLEQAFQKEKDKVRKLKDKYEVKELKCQEQLKKSEHLMNECKKYQDKFTQECEKRSNSESHIQELKKMKKEMKHRIKKLEEEKIKLTDLVKKSDTTNKKLQTTIKKLSKDLKERKKGENRTFEKERQKLREVQRRKKEMTKKIESVEKRSRTLLGKLDSEKRLKTHFERLYREIKLDYERLKKNQSKDDRKAVNTKLIELKLVSDELKEERDRVSQCQKIIEESNQSLKKTEDEKLELTKVAEMAKEKFEKCVKDRDLLIRAVQFIIHRENKQQQQKKKKKKKMKKKHKMKKSLFHEYSEDSDTILASFDEDVNGLEEESELQRILDSPFSSSASSSSSTSSSTNSSYDEPFFMKKNKKGSSMVRIKELALKLEETVHRIKGNYSRSVLRLTSDLDFKKKSLQHYKLYQQNHFVLVRKEIMKLKELHEIIRNEISQKLGMEIPKYSSQIIDEISKFINHEKLSQTDQLIKLQKEHHLEQNELMKDHREKSRLQIRKYKTDLEKHGKTIEILNEKEKRLQRYVSKYQDLKQLFSLLKSCFPQIASSKNKTLENEILSLRPKKKKENHEDEEEHTRRHKMFNELKIIITDSISTSNSEKQQLLKTLRKEQQKVSELESKKEHLKERIQSLISETKKIQSKYDYQLQGCKDEIQKLKEKYRLQELDHSQSREEILGRKKKELERMKSKYHQEIDHIRSKLNRQYSTELSSIQTERYRISDELGKVKSDLGSALTKIEEKKKTLIENLSHDGDDQDVSLELRKKLLRLERENKKLRMKGDRKDIEIKQLSGLLQKTLNRTDAVMKKSEIKNSDVI